jgi:hypothetical protein
MAELAAPKKYISSVGSKSPNNDRFERWNQFSWPVFFSPVHQFQRFSTIKVLDFESIGKDAIGIAFPFHDMMSSLRVHF